MSPYSMTLPPGAEILGAMITPAVLISASGALVISTSNRLGRIVDRSRVLLAQAEELDAATPADRTASHEKRQLITDQLHRLVRRIGLLQNALTSLYVAIGMLVATSISLGVSGAVPAVAGFWPVVLGILGAAALFSASTLLVWEVRIAVRGSYVELAYAMKVVGKKGAG